MNSVFYPFSVRTFASIYSTFLHSWLTSKLPWWLGHPLAGEKKKSLNDLVQWNVVFFKVALVFSCLWLPGAELRGAGLPLKAAMPGCPCETPGSQCWSPSCWWLPMVSHYYKEAFLRFNSKAVMVSGMHQDGSEGNFTSFCFWHFLPNTKDPEKQQ